MLGSWLPMRVLASITCLCLLSSCITTTESSLPGTPGSLITRGGASEAWLVIGDDRPLGEVVLFETFESRPRSVFLVRNVHHQELGFVDALGRAWRYRPHQSEPDWLGSGTVLEGALRILEIEGGGELMEVPLDMLRVDPQAPSAATD